MKPDRTNAERQRRFYARRRKRLADLEAENRRLRAEVERLRRGAEVRSGSPASFFDPRLRG
jgi:cell division protein FtsB